MKIRSLIPFVWMVVVCSCENQTEQQTKSGLNPENFKAEVDGKSTNLYTLVNKNGVEACIMNYGGRLVSLMVLSKGKRA